ncbi:hypothetical protein ACFPRL_10390 [Pseudoclavibacter helvolus]
MYHSVSAGSSESSHAPAPCSASTTLAPNTKSSPCSAMPARTPSSMASFA